MNQVHALTLYDHVALKPLLEPLKRYVLNQLDSPTKSGAVSQDEHIAAVFDRVGELQNCIESMRLALFAVLDLPAAQAESWRQYQYHYENFLLRLTGLVDRAYRLLGSILGLETRTYEKVGGNAVVERAIPAGHESVVEALRKLNDITNAKKSVRNAVAHSTAFSTRELSLFATIEQIDVPDIDMGEVRKLMADHYAAGAEQVAFLLASVVESVQQLLTALAPLLAALASSASSSQK